MEGELINSFAMTCKLMIQYYTVIKKSLIKNKLYKSNKKTKLFIKKLTKMEPLIKLQHETHISKREKNEVNKSIKEIHSMVMFEINKWMKRNPDKNLMKFLNKNIDEYKKTITSLKKKSSKGDDFEMKINSDDFLETDSDSESDSESDRESDSDSDDDETEYDGSEYDDSEYDDDDDDYEDEDSEDEFPEYRSKQQKHKDGKYRNKKSTKFREDKKDKRDKDVDLLRKYLNERIKISTTPIKKQITAFEELSKTDRKTIIDMISNTKDVSCPLIYRVMLSKLPPQVKHDMVERLGSLDKNEDECPKYREWVNAALKIPIGVYTKCNLSIKNDKNNVKKVKKFISETKEFMDNAVYGHNNAKQQILQFVAQNVSNPSPKGLVLGIEGPMGNGKTTLIENGFAKALGRPFATVPLGGIQDGSFLDGHGYTYEGSKWGEIVNILINTRTMNPIIYMDELDKVSQTAKGDEINNMLIHLTDPSQNCHFKDKYFNDINIDLSQVIFIFSYNDRDAINPILMDRITHLKTRGFRAPEKLIICRKHLIKNILADVGIKTTDIKISDNLLNWMINSYTHEGGVRQLKKLCYEIIREINLRQLTNTKYKYPYTVKQKELENDILSRFTKHKPEEIHKEPTVGKINGLYATCNGTGGLIQIEASFIPSDSEFKLQLTGNQGKVMQESMHVANTLSWNLISNELKEKLKAEWKEKGRQGIHVHCPEGGVPKDGPSAGAAITTVMYSLLTGKKIRNSIAITGEIDLSGKIMAIGGLESKIFGAKAAGCKRVICPKDNEDSLRKILKEHPDIQDENFQIKIVENIDEVLKIMLVKSK